MIPWKLMTLCKLSTPLFDQHYVIFECHGINVKLNIVPSNINNICTTNGFYVKGKQQGV